MVTWIINNGGNLHNHSTDRAGFGIDDASFYLTLDKLGLVGRSTCTTGRRVWVDADGWMDGWIIGEEVTGGRGWVDGSCARPWTN